MSRMKSPAQRAPQTLQEATDKLARYAAIDAQIAATNGQRDASIAGINAAADACLVPLDAERKDLAKQLKPWFEANFEELTKGKRKSIELGGCTVGYRVSPPKVAFEHGKDADAVDALLGTGWDTELLRMGKITLDKPAVLKRLSGELHEELIPIELLGFSAPQTEEFFIDRIGATPIVEA